MNAVDSDLFPQLNHSSHPTIFREPECFIVQHRLIRILAGTLTIRTHAGLKKISAGDIILLKKHQLVSMMSYPSATGNFKSTTVYFSEALLESFAAEQQISIITSDAVNEITYLAPNPMYDNYFTSLSAYDDSEVNRTLTAFKVKEALMLMSFIDKHVLTILLDFRQPKKIDMLPFMETYFSFNTGIKTFAFLTGRSLASFKRDFIKNHHTTPGKWLLERRLQEAYALLKDRRMKVMQVYLETGFEDLSHFSFAFKKRFGKAPSRI